MVPYAQRKFTNMLNRVYDNYLINIGASLSNIVWHCLPGILYEMFGLIYKIEYMTFYGKFSSWCFLIVWGNCRNFCFRWPARNSPLVLCIWYLSLKFIIFKNLSHSVVRQLYYSKDRFLVIITKFLLACAEEMWG